MSQKEVTCKTCGQGGLSWRQSAKGKWYLTDPSPVETSYGGNKFIPFAHRCAKDESGNVIKKMTPAEFKASMEAGGFELVNGQWVKK